MSHLYFHIPFCRRRCSYCDFSIAVRKRIPAREYVEAVKAELDAIRVSSGWVNPGAMPRGSWGPDLSTIYFGGGTPSLLPPTAIGALIDEAISGGLTPGPRPGANGDRSPDDLEMTLEANPEDVTQESATAWRHAGVNRISLGAQSFDDRVLRWMHRPHDAARIGAARRGLASARRRTRPGPARGRGVTPPPGRAARIAAWVRRRTPSTAARASGTCPRGRPTGGDGAPVGLPRGQVPEARAA